MSDQLVVVSKIKKRIKEISGMNTSSSAMDQLSKIVEGEILEAIKNAKSDNRKTVMDRDFNQNKSLY
ncbi:MAG: hypothetical protein WB791_03980 [Waddliaceae bacterium]